MEKNTMLALEEAFKAGLRVGSSCLERGANMAQDLRNTFSSDPVKTIFDVGANVGQSAHKFAADFPGTRIHCFEPVRRAYDGLLRNTAHLPNVTAYNLAMSDFCGEARMNVGEETSLSSMVARQPGDGLETVAVTTIDIFCSEHGIDGVELLKIDAEGADLEVLRGASGLLSGGRVAFVQVEATLVSAGRNSRFVALQQFIDQLGALYEVFGIYDQMPHLAGRKSLSYFNVLFVLSVML